MSKKILVCLDDSEQAGQILPYAIEQALQFGGKLIFFKINSKAPVSILGPVSNHESMMTSTGTDTFMVPESDHTDMQLLSLTETLKEHGLEIENVVMEGPYTQAVLKYLTENKVDMVTMTSHAYKGWKRIILGSDIEEILQKCNVPVLVLNPK
jgi:nucleotide-binding universal stress UspA family protein